MYQRINERTFTCPNCGITVQTWTSVEYKECDCVGGPCLHRNVCIDHTSHEVNGNECNLFQVIPKCAHNRRVLKDTRKQLEQIFKSKKKEIDLTKLAETLDDMIKHANDIRVLFKKMHNEPIAEDEILS